MGAKNPSIFKPFTPPGPIIITRGYHLNWEPILFVSIVSEEEEEDEDEEDEDEDEDLEISEFIYIQSFVLFNKP